MSGTLPTELGRVAEIWHYPVKSMQGLCVEDGEIGPAGLADDRRWGIRDLTSGMILSAKREGRLMEAVVESVSPSGPAIRLPDGGRAGEPGAEADALLSGWLGRPVRLEKAGESDPARYEMHVSAEDDDSEVVNLSCPPGTFFDLAPVHVLTTASLRGGAALHSDGRWDVRRFRPTLLVDSAGAEFPEDGWIGSTVCVGRAKLAPFMPTVRCVMTTRAQPGLEADLEIVKTINRHHQASLGVYCSVVAGGRVSVGDAVSVSSPARAG